MSRRTFVEVAGDPVERAPIFRSEAKPRALSVRRVVLALSALLGALGLFWIGRAFSVNGKLRFGNPTELSPLASETPDPQPRQIRAEVTRVSGNPVVRAGDKCDFLVERRLRERDLFSCSEAQIAAISPVNCMMASAATWSAATRTPPPPTRTPRSC